MCVLVAPIRYKETARSVTVSVQIGSTTIVAEVDITGRDSEEAMLTAYELVVAQVKKDYPRAYPSRPGSMIIV